MIQSYQEQALREITKLEGLEKQLKECDVLKLIHGYTIGYEKIDQLASVKEIENGRCYPTKELAEIAMSNSNTRNKLEAYSRVIDAEWREDWEDKNQIKWLIQFDDGKYLQVGVRLLRNIGTVYMSEKAATRIAKALNSGEINV